MKKEKYLKYSVFIIISFYTTICYGQDSEKPAVIKNFRSNELINTQTTESIQSNAVEFNIKHRFGVVSPGREILTEFLGMDLPSNIRLGLAIPISDRLYIGVGRTRFNKIYDFEGKYIVTQQTEDESSPVSIAAYFNAAIRTDNFPSVPDNAYFEDGHTPFEYHFVHRLAYNSQLIISRKFGNKLSLQVAPTLVYRNLVSPERDNYVMAVPIGGSIKTGLTSSIIFEYSYIINENLSNHRYPLSIGYEIATAGHTFQIFLTSSQHILQQQLLTTEQADYLNGNFVLGFNLKRVFWKRNKK
ncbi:DUF5777 family beta-barrel protein [Cytophagaceae bacterium ABcell3]|nr:DUF5777 family beta-barrel protein [Cytophagaceae bacterium ABcell3]